MEITRIGHVRELNMEAGTVDLKIGKDEFRLTNEYGKLIIRAKDAGLLVRPAATNEVIIGSDRPELKW